MKKLLDETQDELTRSLLEAGRAHRPPAGNQAKLLLSLGVGTGVGLFSSKAFAWLGSSAGKLTLVGVGVGIAGAVYTLVPESVAPAQRDVAALRADAVPAQPADGAPAQPAPAQQGPGGPLPRSAETGPAVAETARAAAPESSVPAPAADAASSSRSNRYVPPSASAPRRAHAPAAGKLARRLSRMRSGTAARRDDALAKDSPPDARVLAAGEPAPSDISPAPAPNGVGLESEVALVDAMRGAAARQDADALRRLVASYRGSFPEGQLRQEVAELALRPFAPPR